MPMRDFYPQNALPADDTQPTVSKQRRKRRLLLQW